MKLNLRCIRITKHENGHMEKQETEIKRKLEMETGNGNRKLKTEMETKDAPITGAVFSS